MNEASIKAIGYVRVSTDEQAREGISIEAQQEGIKALATAKGWDLIEIVAAPATRGRICSVLKPRDSSTYAGRAKRMWSSFAR